MQKHTAGCAKKEWQKNRLKGEKYSVSAQKVQLTLTHITSCAALPAGRPSHTGGASAAFTPPQPCLNMCGLFRKIC